MSVQHSEKGELEIMCLPRQQLFLNVSQSSHLFNDTFSLAPELSGQPILIFIYCIHYFFGNSSHLCQALIVKERLEDKHKEGQLQLQFHTPLLLTASMLSRFYSGQDVILKFNTHLYCMAAQGISEVQEFKEVLTVL